MPGNFIWFALPKLYVKSFAAYCLVVRLLKFFLKNYFLAGAGSRGLPWLIFEFMHYGDLAGILLANSGVTTFQNEKLPILTKVIFRGKPYAYLLM